MVVPWAEMPLLLLCGTIACDEGITGFRYI